MAKVLTSLAADVVRYNLGGVVAVAAGIVDLATGQHLGAGVDSALVVAGLAARGLHVKDTVDSSK